MRHEHEWTEATWRMGVGCRRLTMFLKCECGHTLSVGTFARRMQQRSQDLVEAGEAIVRALEREDLDRTEGLRPSIRAWHRARRKCPDTMEDLLVQFQADEIGDSEFLERVKELR